MNTTNGEASHLRTDGPQPASSIAKVSKNLGEGVLERTGFLGNDKASSTGHLMLAWPQVEVFSCNCVIHRPIARLFPGCAAVGMKAGCVRGSSGGPASLREGMQRAPHQAARAPRAGMTASDRSQRLSSIRAGLHSRARQGPIGVVLYRSAGRHS